MTDEDKIHWGLLVATATLAGAVLLAPPSASDAARRSAPTTPRAVSFAPPSEVSRAELEAAITPVKTWVQSAAARARGPLALSLAFQGLGPAGLAPAPPSGALASLLSSAARSPAEDDPIAALAILIEGGLPLEQELPTPSESVSVKELARRTLAARTAAGEPNPWELDLLALLSLRGVRQYDERLAHLTHTSFRQLDLASRDGAARPGGGQVEAEKLQRRAEAWRADPRPTLETMHHLQLSMAAFRAIGVLDEPALEVQARLHLQRLLFGYGRDRAFYEYLVATSVNTAETTRARLEALEYFGRLEQALYGAQIAFRRPEPSEPEQRTAAVMRQAASDLVTHFRELQKARVFDAAHPASVDDGVLLRAAVHALRGLRTARSAAGA